MKARMRNPQAGVAMFFAVFALLLLTAIAAALVLMSNTEGSINSNFRQEQIAYFGAKAGIEEARARMMPSDPNSIFGPRPAQTPCAAANNPAPNPLFDSCYLDASYVAAPATNNTAPMIYYITNPGNGPAIQPWLAGDPYADDELCQDGYNAAPGAVPAYVGLGLTPEPPDYRCASTTLTYTNAPTGAGEAYSTPSVLPFAGTSAALPFKWVRITPKINNSVSWLFSPPASPTALTRTYSVNPNPSIAPQTVTLSPGTPNQGVYSPALYPSTLICWDGQEEVPLTYVNDPPKNNYLETCSQMTSQATAFAGAPMNNVYTITSLGVSPSGARKMLQADVALTPTTPFPYGLYATSNTCPALVLNSPNTSVDSYTTANGGTYATTKSNTGGDVGSNGGVNSKGSIGGIVGVLQPPSQGGIGVCDPPYSGGGSCENSSGGPYFSPTVVCTSDCPTGNWSQPAGTKLPLNPLPNPMPPSCFIPRPYVFPAPPAVNTPNTSYSPPACGGKKGSGLCMVPGTYGNISLAGNSNLTLAPGTYNINSLTMTGNGSITVAPPGAVVLNIGGNGIAGDVLKIAGNGITNDPIPSDFLINYGGTGSVKVAGNGSSTAQLDAPNAPVQFNGNGQWFGSVVASTVNIIGNGAFHFDRAAALAPANNGYFSMISYREVPY